MLNRFFLLLLGEDLLEGGTHKLGSLELILLQKHRFVHSFDGRGNNDSAADSISRSGLVEGVDLVQKILKIILPSELVLEKFLVTSAKGSHGTLCTGVVPVESLSELLVQIHVRWKTGDLVLLENRNVDHVVEQKAASENEVHGENKELGSVIGGVLEEFGPGGARVGAAQTSKSAGD